MTHRLDVQDLRRVYGAGDSALTALDGVSFTAAPGEVVGLLGVNGAGKTTLLKIVATLLLPTSGTVLIDGADVIRRPRDAQRRTALVLGGDRGFYQRVSARENLRYLAVLRGLSRAAARRRADEALEELGLTRAADRAVETFSKGMLQRLHLAAGTLTTPALMLLDEPTLGLDVLEAERLREQVTRLAAQGTTVLLTSHYLADIERLAGRTVILDNGRVSHDLPTAELLARAPAAATITVETVRAPHAAVTPGEGAGIRLLDSGPSATGSGWQLTYQVDTWNRGSLSALARVWPEQDVLGVQVAPASLEAVFAELSAPAVPRLPAAPSLPIVSSVPSGGAR